MVGHAGNVVRVLDDTDVVETGVVVDKEVLKRQKRLKFPLPTGIKPRGHELMHSPSYKYLVFLQRRQTPSTVQLKQLEQGSTG